MKRRKMAETESALTNPNKVSYIDTKAAALSDSRLIFTQSEFELVEGVLQILRQVCQRIACISNFTCGS